MHILALLSMRNRALIALVTIVAAVFGVVALTNLQQELAPSIEFPQLAVVANDPGASPSVVEQDVSTPIETAVQGVANIDTTSSTSSPNLSLVSISFQYGTDLDTAEQKVQEAINGIASTLPSGVTPQVVTGSLDDLPVLQIAVTAPGSTARLAGALDRTTLADIKKIAGVRDAQLLGASGDRITITPDAAKLAAAGLTTQSIQSALQQNGVLIGAGDITQNGDTLSVQSGRRLTSVADVQGLPLIGSGAIGGSPSSAGAGSAPTAGDRQGVAPAAAPTTPVTIGDVATVAQTANPRTSISTVNGRPSLTIAVTKLPSANTVAVSDAVKNALPALRTDLGSGTRFTVVFDQAPYIQKSISSLAEEGLFGLLFAVVVILVFLLSVRSTLVTAISIPTSVLITFIAMWGADYSLNIITLGALTIAIGRVVDDSIVVTENIKRHLQSSPATGEERGRVIVGAVREVASAVTASTITTVAVFLPLAFVTGTTGELFRPFALTVTIALASSLVVSLTIVPVLAYWFLRGTARRHAAGAVPAAATGSAVTETIGSAGPWASDHAPVATGSDELDHPSRLQRGYLPIVRWVVRHSGLTVLFALLVLIGTGGLATLLQTNFLGSSGQDTFTVTQTLPSATSLDAQAAAAKPVERAIRSVDGVRTVQLSIGSSGSAQQQVFLGGGNGQISYSVTTDDNADQTALQSEVTRRLKAIHGKGELVLSASSGFGGASGIEVDVTANTTAELATANRRILAELGTVSEVDQVQSNLSASQPFIDVRIDRAAAAAHGLSEVALGTLVSQATQPTSVGRIVLDDSTENVYLQNADQPASLAQLQSLAIPTSTGSVPLSSLATVTKSEGPATITTQSGLRSATITANPVGQNTGAASIAVQKALDGVSLPASAEASLGGVTSDQNTAFAQLGIALLIAILIVYTVMVATFRSLRQPLELLIAVPFAATGGIVAQLVTGTPLGVASLVGVLMLIGIVVTNAIVLIDLVNQYRRRGLSVVDALVHGASRRLRPILMTALATIFALLPTAVGLTGNGGFISQPLALVVIGGLVSSTLLTLVVLPALYSLVEGRRERRDARRSALPTG